MKSKLLSFARIYLIPAVFWLGAWQICAEIIGKEFLLPGIPATLSALLSLLAVLLFLFSDEGDRVVVTVNGEVYATYALSENVEVDIRTGANGEQLNRLVIRDGQATVETASCPDGICAAHHPVSRDGESIICLPHKVVISVEGKS